MPLTNELSLPDVVTDPIIDVALPTDVYNREYNLGVVNFECRS